MSHTYIQQLIFYTRQEAAKTEAWIYKKSGKYCIGALTISPESNWFHISFFPVSSTAHISVRLLLHLSLSYSGIQSIPSHYLSWYNLSSTIPYCPYLNQKHSAISLLHNHLSSTIPFPLPQYCPLSVSKIYFGHCTYELSVCVPAQTCDKLLLTKVFMQKPITHGWIVMIPPFLT